MSFWGELKRRNVYKVGVAYAIVAWLVIQAVTIIFPVLHLPGWAVTLVTVLVIIGFPFALLFAWAFEVTPDGIKRTKEVPLAESITHLTGQKLNYIVTGLLVLAVAYIVYDKSYLERRAAEPKVVSTETEQAPVVSDVEEAPKTIAVLPFVNLSPDPDQEYFVDGISEEILNTLAQIPDLTVIARTSSFSFKGKDKTIQEIASVLGVDNILEGSVRKAGNALRITAQLIKAVDGSHLWSKIYDKEFKVEEIFSVQEDIATSVADELKVTLGIGESLKQLGGTDNVEAYELFLVARGIQYLGVFDNVSRKLKLIDVVIELDPEFALAWVIKAQTHILSAAVGPTARVDSEYDSAQRAALRAIEIEPELADAYVVLGSYRSVIGDFIEAELAFRKALELSTESLSGSVSMAVFYNGVGYFEKANELLKEIRQNDPLNLLARALYIINLAFLGDMRQAEQENERCRILYGDLWKSHTWAISSLRLNPDNFVSRDEIVFSGFIWDTAKDKLGSPNEGLAELRRIYTNSENLSVADFSEIVKWAAYFGDPEFAMEVFEKMVSFECSGLFWSWSPVMKEVRRMPRFKELVKEIGLVDYWNKFGWPDICHPLDNGDFECD